RRRREAQGADVQGGSQRRGDVQRSFRAGEAQGQPDATGVRERQSAAVGAVSELAAGTELAGYRIEGLAGRGGMGVVYRAQDLALQRPVALKVLSPDLAEDDRFRERFLRESRLAASLDHPSIVPVYDAGEARGDL